jgi:hypothetical protein
LHNGRGPRKQSDLVVGRGTGRRVVGKRSPDVTVLGWAVDNGTVVGTAINSVQVKVDGTVIGTAAYGSSRADVCAVFVGRPGCPNVGYSFPWNTSGLSAGVHILTLTATDGNGNADVGNASVVVIK